VFRAQPRPALLPSLRIFNPDLSGPGTDSRRPFLVALVKTDADRRI
jgi:hypothetical protein